MQQEQEHLKEELELRVAEVQEENREKLAEATLIELELQDDMSETNEEFQETLSLLSKESHEHQSTRVHNWVNNSPTLTCATNQRIPEALVVESNQEPTVGTQPLLIAASASNKNAASSTPMLLRCKILSRPKGKILQHGLHSRLKLLRPCTDQSTDCWFT